MKRRMFLGCMAVLAAAAVAGCGAGGNDIGSDEAQRIALEDAGTTEDEVTRLRVSQDSDDGRKVYEIQFSLDVTDYEYEIQASDGTILSSDREETGTAQGNTQTDDGAQNGQETQNTQEGQNDQNAQNSQNTQNTQQVALSEADARALALERVPGAGEQDVRMELDYDDGQYKYEGDIIYNNIEYDFEIDANTGTFLEWSEERR